MTMLSKGVLGLVAGATALTAAAPAEAQWRGRYYRDRGGDVATAAIVGGVAGLAIGSVIANDRRGRYWNRGYYRGGYYDRGFYGPPRRGWNRGWYGPPRRFYRPRCFNRWQYDPYIGRRVRVRYC